VYGKEIEIITAKERKDVSSNTQLQRPLNSWREVGEPGNAVIRHAMRFEMMEHWEYPMYKGEFCFFFFSGAHQIDE